MTITRSLSFWLSKSISIHSIKNVKLLRIPTRELSSKRKALHDLLVNMPKEPVHLEKLKGIRKEKRETMVKYPAGFINLQVLGNGSVGASTSLYVFTDQTRYLFNCGEGSQRLAHEHKVKLSKLEHVFITSKLWKVVGGLPGLILTIQDIGVPSVTIHGPPGMDQLFEGTKRFVILKDLEIHVADCTNPNVTFYEDHVMRIDYVPLYPNTTDLQGTVESSSSSDGSPPEDDNIDYYSKAKGTKRPLEIIRDDFEEKRVRSSKSSYPDSAICYICRPKEKAGTLIIEKCVEMGVPAGPLLGKLKSGEDVTLPNGKVVKAQDVTSPHDPGPVFIIADCPNLSYLDSLVENPIFTTYQKTGTNEKDAAHIVVHFTPQHIIEHPKYVKWMESFHQTTQHLMLNEFCEGTGSEAIHRVQYKLNQLDADIFPLLEDTKMPVKGVDLDSLVTRTPPSLENVALPFVMGNTLLKFNLRPTIGLDALPTVTLSPESYIQETKHIEDFSTELENYKGRLGSLQTTVQDYPKIIFLGTGSCIPNKTRNTSGIIVQLNSDSRILLDCGEGTFGQLFRFFGPDKLDNVLTSLKAVYISHLHADHHLGLINIILERVNSFNRLNLPFIPLTIIAPVQITSWLKLFHKNFDKIKSSYELVPNASLYFQGQSIDPIELKSKILDPLDLVSFQTCGVRHCPNAFGVAFTGNGDNNTNWKLTYSGDTMPCDYLVTLGQNSDVLIHEATMEDELKEEAVYKMHSTTSEAITIGKKMSAKFTILTHFSQRYAKVPKIGNELESNVGIAFDNMCVRLSDLPKIPLMYPALKTLFAEHYEEMEIKTAKKMKRREKLIGSNNILSEPGDETTNSISPKNEPQPVKIQNQS